MLHITASGMVMMAFLIKRDPLTVHILSIFAILQKASLRGLFIQFIVVPAVAFPPSELNNLWAFSTHK